MRCAALLLILALGGCAGRSGMPAEWDALPRFEARQGPSPILRPGYVTGSRTRA